MAHETVPAEIAAAIEELQGSVCMLGAQPNNGCVRDEVRKDRRALDAAILKHLRNADEMKAALERIEQGV